MRASNLGGLTDQSPASVTWLVSETLVDPTPAEIKPPVIRAAKKVKSGKKIKVNVRVSNTGETAAEVEVCVKSPKKLVKGKAQRCRTISVDGESTASTRFTLKTKPRKKGKRVKLRVSTRDVTGDKKPKFRGHVTVLK